MVYVGKNYQEDASGMGYPDSPQKRWSHPISVTDEEKTRWPFQSETTWLYNRTQHNMSLKAYKVGPGSSYKWGYISHK